MYVPGFFSNMELNKVIKLLVVFQDALHLYEPSLPSLTDWLTNVTLTISGIGKHWKILSGPQGFLLSSPAFPSFWPLFIFFSPHFLIILMLL